MKTETIQHRHLSGVIGLVAGILLAGAPSITYPADTLRVVVHKSLVIPLAEPATRVSVGDPAIADVLLTGPREVYVLGKKIGSTNILIWTKAGLASVFDVAVDIDAQGLRATLKQVLPNETGIIVSPSNDSIVLGGEVADPFKIDRAVAVAESFAGEHKVVNMMHATAPQQVLLEVKVAEISKILLDRVGANFNIAHNGALGGTGWAVSGGFLTDSQGLASLLRSGATTSSFTVDALNKDQFVKILAEPNIMAVSGQEGTFLAGGKIFIPVPQGNASSLTITLEEKEFGIGLRFTPTVLEDGVISLRVTPEVSELNQQGVVIEATGIGKTVLPSITTRRASTTVQLRDGQTFAIGGLIKSNVTATVARFPLLGELPILGALFRSSEFQRDRSELLFVITPHLVKPLEPGYSLPTDGYVEPSRVDVLLGGKLEGERSPTPAPSK
ncbi:MAG: type II and III secretion system protein family protein [Proteobacteria bacterium]|nr:type II and III secretion system protein family protein [Pseudomonadota bacterium]